jgi:cytoskeletal protein CcmA (bactofilin family)
LSVGFIIKKEESMAFGNGTKAGGDLGEPSIYLGKNVYLRGDLHLEGSGRIDGKVEGKIRAKGTLTLGEEGIASSEIEGDTVIVGGKVEGKIIGREKVELVKTSVVNADVMTPCFAIEEGAQFNGSCRMSNGQQIGNHSPQSNEIASLVAAGNPSKKR